MVKPCILVVKVLYQRKIKDLHPCADKLLIFDNSPEFNSDLDFNKEYCEYFPMDRNQGLAIPYNLALKKGIEEEFTHLMLVDQDSYFNDSFFNILYSEIIKNSSDVYLPKVFHKNILLSPLYNGFFNTSPKKSLFSSNRLLFINSGTVFNISFLEKIGGFNETFWLDFQDYWLSLMAYNHSASISIIDYNINHNLSLMNKEYISIERYKNLHYYEALYFFKYESALRKSIYVCKILLRFIKRFPYFLKNNFLLESFSLILKALKNA